MNAAAIDVGRNQRDGSLNRSVRDLLGKRDPLRIPPGIWNQLRRGLETMPLSTSAFGLALNRLQNAETYWLEGEWGAARFELQMLLAGLKS